MALTLKTFALLLVFAVLALFAIVNWSSFMAPTNLWLLAASINAPLGLILLGFIIVISLLFLIYIAYLQTIQLSETRRFNKELKLQRELAENAETSRITGLHEFLKAESAKTEGKARESQTELQNRFDQLDRDLRSVIETTGNTLAAYMGELEDRLTKQQMRE